MVYIESEEARKEKVGKALFFIAFIIFVSIIIYILIFAKMFIFATGISIIVGIILMYFGARDGKNFITIIGLILVLLGIIIITFENEVFDFFENSGINDFVRTKFNFS